MSAQARGPPPTGRASWQRQQASYATSGALPPQLAQPAGAGPRGAHPSEPLTAPIAQLVSEAPNAGGNAAIPVSSAPPIPTFSHIPYFTAIQLETLYTRRRGTRMSASTWQTNRDMATGFIQSVASRLGFPQRTTATAQQIYQRFHLFFPPSDFVLHEIAVASLFVAAKLNDTNKKPRDVLLASYALRFPQLVKGGSAASALETTPTTKTVTDEPNFPTLAGQKRKHALTSAVESLSPNPLAMAIGSVGEADVDPNILENDRKRLMALEKLILESLCYNFQSNACIALKMVIKLGRKSKLPKSFIRTSWKMAADLFRTSAPMQYPPNVIAVAALYAAALLARPPSRTTIPSEQGQQVAADTHQDDPLVAFLNNIKAVSATPSPASIQASPATPSLVPLSEPFAGCDPECRVHVEDVEEAVHELLDLFLTCTAQLPPSLYMTSASGLGTSTAATPSPLSPADPLDAFATSPSSSGGMSDPSQPAPSRKKLKQYEYSPPPFGLVDWLNSARCTQLQLSAGKSAAAVGGGIMDPTAPTKELSALLTDLKIYLRGIEYDRQRADAGFLAEVGLLAEANVVPLPGVDAASMSGVGQPVAAHSVTIELRPLGNSDASIHKSGDQIWEALDDAQKRIVERIRRRKLVAALRLTFVEPQVEKRADVGGATVTSRDEYKQSPTEQRHQSLIKESADQTLPLKRNRIEQARRYLF